MRKFIGIICFLCVGIVSFGQTYTEEVQIHRDSVDIQFADAETSILEKNDLKDFEGLHYFEIDESYKVKATFKKIKKGKEFKMKTSTNRLPVYKPYGVLKFKIDGKNCQLVVYQNVDLIKIEDYEDYLFIPFTDLTSGLDSYGGGRYLDISIQDLENPELDFNLCYNPYCAYNSDYSCPIPPSVNDLDVKIEAGVKSWH